MTQQSNIRFTFGNAKLSKGTAILSLLAGHNCPGAKDCKSQVVETPEGMRIQDGEHTEFRCYAASMELRSKPAYNMHKANFEALKAARTVDAKVKVITDAIEAQDVTDMRRVRIHASGDFFVQSYFDAWIEVARKYPDLIFYAYTKSLKFWVRRIDSIPSNFKLTASYGGHNDSLIEQHNLKAVTVVYSHEEAEEAGLPIDKDDTHAWAQDGNFAQLIHGTQPAGSKASKAKEALKKVGYTGYGKGSKKAS
ncbi:MAG: hypothetical protein P8J32_04780 [bacterium]|nr:hypothetical protein [bacterium]